MIKVQYGTGPGVINNDWINFDSSPTLLIQKIPIIGKLITKNKPFFDPNLRFGDIVKGLPLEEESVDFLFCSHVLEHLSLCDFDLAIKNSFALLKEGGSFGIIVPDLEVYINSFIGDKYNKNSMYPSIDFLKNTHLGLYGSRIKFVERIFYAFSNSRHLSMWDERTLKNKLLDIGFSDVSINKKVSKKCVFEQVILPNRLKNSIFVICKK